MFKFPKLFGRGASTSVVDESAPFKEDIQELENDIPVGEELSDKIDSLVQEVESQPLPRNAAKIFVVDKAGNRISLDEHRENVARADQNKIQEVRQKINVVDKLPDLVSRESSKIDFSQAENFSDLYNLINRGGVLQGSAKEYTPQELISIIDNVRSGKLRVEGITQTNNLRKTVRGFLEKETEASLKKPAAPETEADKEIRILDEKIADPEAGVSNQEVVDRILAKNQIKMSSVETEREAKERALDIAINSSGSFTALRKVLTDSDYEKKAEVLSLIARAEDIVKDAYAKGENFQTFAPAFIKLIPDEYELPSKIREIGVAISNGLNKKIKGPGRSPVEDSKSRIIFPPTLTKEESELEDLKKRIALANESPEMVEKRKIAEEQGAIVRANLADLAVKEAKAATEKAELEAQEAARKENDERYRSSRWIDPNNPSLYRQKEESIPPEMTGAELIAFYAKSIEEKKQANGETAIDNILGEEKLDEKEKEATLKVTDTRSSQGMGISLEGIKNISAESGEEESGLKIIDKRSSRDLAAVEESKPRSWEVSDKRAIKPIANESLVIGEKEIAEALAKSESPVNNEVVALDASLGEDNISIEAAKRLLETLPAIKPTEAEVEKKNLGFWGKAKSILGNSKVQAQLLTAGISSAASVLGFKAFYDVPAYFSQRYTVRGIFGKGKGLKGSAEELIGASQNRKSEIDEKSQASQGSVMEAIKDLDKRLAKTKEGSKKGSEQRQKLAKLLWENRHQAKQTGEERKKELDDILDNYTSTKVSGIQATREALNTALVASGAFALRGVTYGGLAYFEKLAELRREARIEMAKGDSSLSKDFIKNKAEENVGIKQVFARGLKETFDGVRLKSGKNKTEKTLAAIKSWGSIARFTGIALGIGGGQIYHGASLDKVIDAVEGKLNLAGAGHNFTANAHRLIPSFGTVEAATSTPAGAEALPAEMIQPQVQNIVAEKMNLNENHSEAINNLDKMLKADSSETVIPINKIASVLPTEEITAAVGSPEHVQAFLSDPENKKALETLSEKAEAFFNPRITQAERNAAGADISSLKVAFEKEFGAKMSFDLDGDVTLRYPNGQSLKIFEGDGRNFVTEHNLATSQAAESVAGTESGNPVKAEIAPSVVTSPEPRAEDLDFSKALIDEKTLPEAEAEVLPKSEDDKTAENLKEILDKIDNRPVAPEITPEAIPEAPARVEIPTPTPEVPTKVIDQEISSTKISNTFKPLDDAISGSGRQVLTPEINNSESVNNLMTLAEAKSFDQPLLSADLVKNLAEQGAYINLRNVPSVSPEVLQVFNDLSSDESKGFNFNLLGLKAELLDSESLKQIGALGNRAILSDEVLRRVEQQSA